MVGLGPEMRWIVAAILLGSAAVVIYLARRRLALLVAALAIAPLPALLFLRLTLIPPERAPDDQLAAGLVLAGLSCYLAPALGALTAAVINRWRMGAKRQTIPATRDEAEPDSAERSRG